MPCPVPSHMPLNEIRRGKEWSYLPYINILISIITVLQLPAAQE